VEEARQPLHLVRSQDTGPEHPGHGDDTEESQEGEMPAPGAGDRHDAGLVGGVLALAAFGVVLVGAATSRHGPGFAARQLVWVALGVAAMAGAASIDLEAVRRRANLLYLVALGGLVLVLSPLGARTNGAQAWFSLGPLALQPAELMKPALVLALAAHGARAGGPLDGRRPPTHPPTPRLALG
jgi:cell division protein FtsW (lipid II flippase)